MAISGVLAATFVFALALPLIYSVLAVLWRKTKPSADSVFNLMSSAVGVVASLRLLWLVFFEEVPGLSNQARYYLLIGVAATGWYGIKGVLKTFNKLLKVELQDEDKE